MKQSSIVMFSRAIQNLTKKYKTTKFCYKFDRNI